MQRHVGSRLSSSGYTVLGDAHQSLRSDWVLSNDGQVADLYPTSSGLGSCEHEGGAPGSAAGPATTPHRPFLRRDNESTDCDMPDRSNTELSTPLRHPVTTGDGSPLLTDAMLVDPDERNPLMPLSSGDCAMTIDSPLRRNRGPKGKKRLHQNPSGNGHKKPRGYTGRISAPHLSTTAASFCLLLAVIHFALL